MFLQYLNKNYFLFLPQDLNYLCFKSHKIKIDSENTEKETDNIKRPEMNKNDKLLQILVKTRTKHKQSLLTF